MKRSRWVIEIGITLVIIACLMVPITKLVERKDSISRYSNFFSSTTDFDVFFFGTSHVLNAFFPMELWNEYGITSYNFGGHDCKIPTSYWCMRNVFEHSSPKVVVIDCFDYMTNQKTSADFSYMHTTFDAFPMTLTKIFGVMDLVEKKEGGDQSSGTRYEGEEPTYMGLLWDFCVYHSRWNELTENDFTPYIECEMGAESRIAVTPVKYVPLKKVEANEVDSVGEKYLRKMIEMCQERGIEVVLTYLPFPADEERQKEAKAVESIAEEYGVQYINYIDEEVVDYLTDMYDKDSHLNPSGARKVSHHIGSYLSKTADINDKRENGEYTQWNRDYFEYASYKNDLIRNCSRLDNYLALLSGDDIRATLYIIDSSIMSDKVVRTFMENWGIAEDQVQDNCTIDIDNDCIFQIAYEDEYDLKPVNDDCIMVICVYRDGAMIDKVEVTYDLEVSMNRVLNLYRSKS